MIHVFIRTNDRSEPFIETVSNYMFGEKGDLHLYDKNKMWYFPCEILTYVYIEELEDKE